MRGWKPSSWPVLSPGRKGSGRPCGHSYHTRRPAARAEPDFVLNSSSRIGYTGRCPPVLKGQGVLAASLGVDLMPSPSRRGRHLSLAVSAVPLLLAAGFVARLT